LLEVLTHKSAGSNGKLTADRRVEQSQSDGRVHCGVISCDKGFRPIFFWFVTHFITFFLLRFVWCKALKHIQFNEYDRNWSVSLYRISVLYCIVL